MAIRDKQALWEKHGAFAEQGPAALACPAWLDKTGFVQNAPAQVVVGSLDNPSTMRLFTWRDAENAITSGTVAISQIQQGASYTSLAHDGSHQAAVSFP